MRNADRIPVWNYKDPSSNPLATTCRFYEANDSVRIHEMTYLELNGFA